MSVAENIDTAVSLLWKLAMAMSSLRHIAGMDGQEEDLASASAGQEEDHSLPDTHRDSHVDETDASGDDSFANKENTESEEIELAALISSLTLTMVYQQNKAPGMNVSKELIENVYETEPESVPISSMIGHQLPKLDSLLDISMVSHHHSVTENNVDSGSLVYHQTQTSHNVQHHERESIEMSEFERNLTEQKGDSAFSTTLLAHKASPVDTYLESSEFPTSMVAHMIISNGDEETLLQANENVSMVVHQIVNEKTSATEIKKPNETVKDLCDYITSEDEENCIIRESKFISSLCSHQISPNETPLEYPVSLYVHTVDNYSEDMDMSLKIEPGMISSMVSHQYCKEEKFTENLKPEELSVKNVLNILPTDCNDQQIDQNLNYYSSVGHQLPNIAADGEFLTSLVSARAHGVMTGTSDEDIIEPESGLLTSMVSHQFPAFSDDVDDNVSNKAASSKAVMEAESKSNKREQKDTEKEKKTLDLSLTSHKLPFRACASQFDSPSYVPSMEAYQKISDVDENTNSMAAHTTDNLRKESNEGNMRNHYQGKTPEGVEEEEGRFYVVEDFKIKRKNNERISENNVETTETHIVNSFKGVEFESCIILHQQLDEEYETKDPADVLSDEESVSSVDESIQSMLTTAEKIDHLDTFEDLISESASENLIAASCTIEDNSPVVITTSNQIIDETDRIAEQFKNNHQADIYENETKNQEEENNLRMKNKETGILRSLTTEAKDHGKSKKKENSQKSFKQIATFNANSGKETYKIRFKVKPNEDPSKSFILKYLLGYFGGQQ